MAATSLTGKRRGRRSPVPYLLVAGILLLIGWRIHYLVVVAEVRSCSFVGAFFSSLQLGSLYALIALGYTMVYGIIRLINFAHGEVFMVGAFVSYFLFTNTPYSLPGAILGAAFISLGVMFLATLWRGYQLGHPLILAIGAVSLVAFTFVLSMADLGWIMALIFSMLTTGVVGVAIDRIAYHPARRAACRCSNRHRGVDLCRTSGCSPSPASDPYRPETMWTDSCRSTCSARRCSPPTDHPDALLLIVLVTALHLLIPQVGRAMLLPRTGTMDDGERQRVIATIFFLGAMLGGSGVLWGMNWQPEPAGGVRPAARHQGVLRGSYRRDRQPAQAVLGGLILGFLENFLTAVPTLTSQA